MGHFLHSVDIRGKSVLVRLDLDLPLEKGKFDTTRLSDGAQTLQYLIDHDAKKITVIGHRGRPEGKKVSKLSLKPVEKLLLKTVKIPKTIEFRVLENLRYDKREESGSLPYAKELAKGHDMYVNDAFASSHRKHTSITFIPQILPTYFGLQFEKELKGLAPLITNQKRPFIAILGGAKIETKLPIIKALQDKADVILVGGKLAVELIKHPIENRKLIVGVLTKDGKDISKLTVEQFARFISMGQTIMWNGPMGKFEDAASRSGTRAIGNLLAGTKGYTVVGGGDTEAALSILKVRKGISFISSGGGAMLDYVAYGTLPGIEAVQGKEKYD